MWTTKALILALLGSSFPAFGQFESRISYSTTPDTSGTYRFLPKSEIVVETPSRSAASLLEAVYKNTASKQMKFPPELLTPAVDGNAFILSKDRFFPINVATYYTERYAKNLVNCVNHIKIDKSIAEYAKFVAQHIEIDKMNESEINEITRHVATAARKIRDFALAHNWSCPKGDSGQTILFPSDVQTVEDVFFSIFVPVHVDPSPQWNDINRNHNYSLFTGEDGLRHTDGKIELTSALAQVISVASIPVSFVKQIEQQEYTDFFTFTAELRSWLSENNKSPVIAKEIGIACIDSIEAAFEPFKLGTCLESGKLQRISANDAIMLVRADDE